MNIIRSIGLSILLLFSQTFLEVIFIVLFLVLGVDYLGIEIWDEEKPVFFFKFLSFYGLPKLQFFGIIYLLIMSLVYFSFKFRLVYINAILSPILLIVWTFVMGGTLDVVFNPIISSLCSALVLILLFRIKMRGTELEIDLLDDDTNKK